jgi:hypothetical protein
MPSHPSARSDDPALQPVSGSPVLVSLRAFLMAGLRPKTPLAKAVVTVLLIKVVLILVLRLTLFSSAERPHIDAESAQAHFGPATSSSSNR